MSNAPLSASWKDLPSEFLQRLPEILCPEDLACFRQFTEQPRPLSARITDDHLSHQEAKLQLEQSGFSVRAIDWMPEAMLLSPPDRRLIQETMIHTSGGMLIQSLSSMAAVEALDVMPGHDVLDCCAAPGGKASLIRFRQQGQGILVANDLSRRRIQKMQRLFGQIHVEGVDVHMQSAETLGGSHATCFDRVLLDAPCSGEGRFRLDSPSTWNDWEPGKIRRLAKLQQRLLRSALRTLRPDGVLVYSTCTLAPEENEVVLSRILNNPPFPIAIEPVEVDCPGRRPALLEWKEQQLSGDIQHAMRIIPEDGMTPFFIARIRRIS